MELLFALLLLLFIPVVIRWSADGAGGRTMAVRQGLRLVPDSEIPLVTQRVQELIQPLPHAHVNLWRPGPIFTMSVEGRAAFLYELRYATALIGEFGPTGHGHNYQRAYVILGAGAPFLRAMPKGILSLRERLDGYRPASSIAFPQDRPFSGAFWVEGADEVAIRSYLGPQLRHFLLAHAKGWRFNAGPEGVALLHCGRTPSREMSRVAVTLERLAVAAEATRL